MAFAPLILQESLRPWQAAGVTHFLLDADAAAGRALQTGSAAAYSARPQAAPFPPEGRPERRNIPLPPQDGPAPTAPREASASAAASGASPSLAVPAVSAAPVRPEPGVGPEEALPPRPAWPELWSRQFARMPEQPLVVWTYAALGRDLCATPDAERRERLRALLQPLGLPKGSGAFLPCLLPDIPAGAPVPSNLDNADFVPNRPVFWAALREIKPRLLVVFGLKALEAIWPGHALRFYQQASYMGMQLIVLPDLFPERREPDAAALPVAAVSAYLSTVFSALLRMS